MGVSALFALGENTPGKAGEAYLRAAAQAGLVAAQRALGQPKPCHPAVGESVQWTAGETVCKTSLGHFTVGRLDSV